MIGSTRAYMLLLIGLVVCLGPSPAFPQAGMIGVSSDYYGSSCNIADPGGGLVQVYVHYFYSPGSRGTRFRLNVEGTGWTHLGDLPEFPWTVGTSIDSVTICWDQCLSGSFLLLIANFFGSAALPCTMIGIDTYPGAGLEGLDCDLNVVNPAAGRAYVNADASCPCTACLTGMESACVKKVGPKKTALSNFCATVPVEQSTWGTIKSLYR